MRTAGQRLHQRSGEAILLYVPTVSRETFHLAHNIGSFIVRQGVGLHLSCLSQFFQGNLFHR